jgi:Helix-turn-helix domain
MGITTMKDKRERRGAEVVPLPAANMDPDASVNETQAAMFLGVSVRTLQAWRVRGGGPPYVKIGRTVRYRRRALLAFQDERTVTSTTEADAKAGA